MSIDHIMKQLWSFTPPAVFNPWRDTDPTDVDQHGFAPVQRQERLRAHFDCKARLLLIGEAPGYQGCHFSGVPFTNERLLLDGVIPRLPQTSRITTRRLPWSEPAATIMWRTLHELGIAECTVMWNAHAWHPHEPECLLSNRTPTQAEVLAGKDVLIAVLEHFAEARVIAVGRVAERALKLLSIKHEALRHPARGGANEFAAGMRRLCRREVLAK